MRISDGSLDVCSSDLKFATIDTLDCTGSNILVELKESEIVRVLPRNSSEINFEWITDKIRFSYDSLKRSRINSFFIKNFNVFQKIEVFKLLKIIKPILTKQNVLIPIQSNIDNKTLLILNALSRQIRKESCREKVCQKGKM